MDKIKYNRDIGLVNPVMVAGWPGMGSVALGVVDYLQRKLGAVKFAEIEVDPLEVIDSVIVEDGVAAFAPIPKNTFYYSKNPDLIMPIILFFIIPTPLTRVYTIANLITCMPQRAARLFIQKRRNLLKYCAAHAHHGGTFFNGDFIITAHAHG